MKSKSLLIAIIILSFTVSCKNEDKNNKSGEDLAKPAIKEYFRVEIYKSASKRDDFSLYYTEDNSVNFSGALAIWHGVTGGNVRETISFDLSEELLPTDIRLDFGINKDQETVMIYNVKIGYYENELNIKGSDFFNYFIENKEFKTEIDNQNGALKILKNGAEYKTPYFYPRQELIDALKKMTSSRG